MDRGKKEFILDAFGEQVRVGEFISYPIQKGHSMYLKVGRVINISDTDKITVNSVELMNSGVFNERISKGVLTVTRCIVKFNPMKLPENLLNDLIEAK